MPVTMDVAACVHADSAPRRMLLTRRDCQALRDSGLLPGRYELIQGEIIEKMGQNEPHYRAVIALRDWLMDNLGHKRIISQMPIDVHEVDNPTNEPELDVAVTREHASAYGRQAKPAEILLVGEVSDTSLAFDLVTKAALYARAGIPEYWVLDITGRQLIVHRAPVGNVYADVAIHGADEEIATLALPEARVLVGELFTAA